MADRVIATSSNFSAVQRGDKWLVLENDDAGNTEHEILNASCDVDCKNAMLILREEDDPTFDSRVTDPFTVLSN